MQNNLTLIWTEDLKSQAYQDLKKLRIAVFVKELHGDLPTEIHDEEKCRYLVIYNKNHFCIGGARLLKLNADTMRIQRVAIAKPYRGNGIGHKLLSELEQACFRSKCQRIEIVARYTAQDFYASLGYQPENSDTFIRSGVPHQLFYKELN